MQNKKWKKFGTLTGKCYLNMAGAEKDGSCWEQAFELLKEIIREERQKNPEFALTMEEIDAEIAAARKDRRERQAKELAMAGAR